MKKILIPLPAYGFDPTEAAVPWKQLFENKFQVVFATPSGEPAAADLIMLNGKKLGILAKVLMARMDAVAAYSEMLKSDAFVSPLLYEAIDSREFDGLLLPGGHDKAVKEYLESSLLQQQVLNFLKAGKPVAAICHGVVLVARSIDPDTGKSAIYEFKTTALLKSQELTAYWMTRVKLKDYYLTYPGLPVESEVKAALSSPSNFIKGPMAVFRDDFNHLRRGFIVRDRNYLSARWPGDVYNFSIEFMNMLNGK